MQRVTAVRFCPFCWSATQSSARKTRRQPNSSRHSFNINCSQQQPQPPVAAICAPERSRQRQCYRTRHIAGANRAASAVYTLERAYQESRPCLPHVFQQHSLGSIATCKLSSSCATFRAGVLRYAKHCTSCARTLPTAVDLPHTAACSMLLIDTYTNYQHNKSMQQACRRYSP